MTQPYPLPREIRSTGAMSFDGVNQAFGPFAFSIFDLQDVKVLVRHENDRFYSDVTGSVTVTKTGASAYDTFSVDFGQVHPVSSVYVVEGARVPERSVSVIKGGGIKSNELEKELTKNAVEDAELRRDYDRAVKAEPGETGPIIERLPDGHFYKVDTDGNLIDGGSASDIDNAQQNASSAAADAAAAAAAKADAETAAASLASRVFTSITGLRAATVPAVVMVVQIFSYSDSIALAYPHEFKREASAPADNYFEQSADGTHWSLIGTQADFRLWGAVGDGATSNDTAIQGAISWLNGKEGRHLEIFGGTYEYAVEPNCTQAKTTIELKPGAELSPTVQFMSVWQLRGDGSQFKGAGEGACKVSYNGTRQVINDAYENEPGRNRQAVYVTAKNCIVEGFSCDNLDTGVFIRGHLTDPLISYSGNVCRNVCFTGCDQGLLAVQQDQLELHGLKTEDVAFVQGVEPHAIYISGDPVTKPNGKVITHGCHTNRNLYDSAYKFTGCNLDAWGLTGKSMMILMQVVKSTGQAWGCSLDDQYDPGGVSTFQGVNINQSHKFVLSDCVVFSRDGEENTFGFRAFGSSTARFVNCKFFADRNVDNGTAAFVLDNGSHDAEVINCAYENRGSGNSYMFDIASSNNCSLVLPCVYGTDRLVRMTGTTSGTTLLLDFSGLGTPLSEVMATATEPLWFRNTGTGSGGTYDLLNLPTAVVIADGDATPFVSFAKIFKTANTAATTITKFEGGQSGDRILIMGTDANTTINDNSDIRTNGNLAWNTTGGDFIEFIKDSTIWREIGARTDT